MNMVVIISHIVKLFVQFTIPLEHIQPHNTSCTMVQFTLFTSHLLKKNNSRDI